MATESFVALLILASCLTIACCLQCYHCIREDNPDAEEYCELSSPSALGNNTIVNCSQSENRCLITKRIVEGKSVTLFKRMCVKSQHAQVCKNECSAPDEDGAVICDSCCEEDLCNKGEGPTEAAQTSGTSRILVMRGLYLLWGLLVWFL